jgi:putative sterol carrier protein
LKTVREIFEAMPASFQPGAAAGLVAVIQFDIRGPDGGAWYAEIRDGSLALREGMHPAPSATVRSTDADYLAVANGTLGEMKAFLTGKIRVSGNLAVAMKLNRLFKRG